MDWQIIFSPQALQDLAKVVTYIAQQDPIAAEKVGHALIDRVLILERFPYLGSPFRLRDGVRRLISKPYVIFYRAEEADQKIEILRYWHSARGEIELPG